MKTVAITAAYKWPWPEMLAEIRRRWHKLNGYPLMVMDESSAGHILSSLPGPAWAKAFVWEMVEPDVERLVWIDADIVPVRPIGAWPNAVFAAARDSGATVANVRAQFMPLSGWGGYFNAGFWMATRASRRAFLLLQAMMSFARLDRPGMYAEQSLFNLAVLLTLGGYGQLSEDFNWMVKTKGWHPQAVSDGCRHLHFAGIEPEERKRLMEEALEAW